MPGVYMMRCLSGIAVGSLALASCSNQSSMNCDLINGVIVEWTDEEGHLFTRHPDLQPELTASSNFVRSIRDFGFSIEERVMRDWMFRCELAENLTYDEVFYIFHSERNGQQEAYYVAIKDDRVLAISSRYNYIE
jgi:hypothetical protein